MNLNGEKSVEAFSQSCSSCKQIIQHKDPKKCEFCGLYYHARCQNTANVKTIVLNDRQTIACLPCADKNNAMSTKVRTKSTSATTSAAGITATTSAGRSTPKQQQQGGKRIKSAPPSTSTSRNPSPARTPDVTTPTPSVEAALRDIRSALDDIRNAQRESLKTQNIVSERISKIEQRLNPIEMRLKALDELPALKTRLQNAESTITELQTQVQDLSSRSPTTQQDSSSTVPDAAEICNLRSELAEVKRRQEQTSNSVVVVTGLHYTRETSLHLLAFSVMSALDPTVLRRDIASVRIMGRLDATNNSARGDSRLLPLAVTLSSSALARSIVIAKARKRKLHTSELDATLLGEARALSPDHQGLININELLPADVHKLRSRARLEAKKRQGSRTFVRDGRLYMRCNDGSERATIINTYAELDTFLARLQPAADIVQH